MTGRVPAVILGGTGYVAGELLRLTLGHPRLELVAIASDSQPGEPVAKAFPHLASACGELRYVSIEQAVETVARHPRSGVLAAAPHGVSHRLIDGLLNRAASAGAKPSVVDISADFRYADLAEYERVYKHPHGAPARAREFTCAVPEHLDRSPTPHVAHPGCFCTATLLASVPLLSLDLAEPPIFVSAVTGSTGAGRSPIPGTHHPQRHSDLYAYNALTHRHQAEISALARAATRKDGRIRLRAAFGTLRARHSCDRAGGPEETARHAGRDRGDSRFLCGPAVRARAFRAATDERRGREQLCSPVGRG